MYREWPFQRRPLPSVLAWMMDSKSRSVEDIVKDIRYNFDKDRKSVV